MNGPTFTRHRAKNIDPAFSGSPRAKSDKWQLVIERDIPNPEFVPKSEALDDGGKDTRTYRQKRRSKTEQRTKMYEGDPVSKAVAVKAAEAWMNEENARIERPDESSMTVADYVDAYISEIDISDSTLTGYLGAAKHIRKAFSRVQMSELDTLAIERWLVKLKKEGYAEQTRYRDFKVLRMACRHAARRDVGVIDFDPCENVRKRPEQNKTRTSARVNSLTLTAPEGGEPTLYKHLRVLADMEPTPMVTAAYIATYTGMRCGEICALRWRDVDMAHGVIRVRTAVGIKGKINDERGGAFLKDPKTDDSERAVPIAPELAALLDRRRSMMRDDLDESAIVDKSGEYFSSLFVIGEVDGTFKNPTTLSKQWKAHAENFGLKGETGQVVTFHGLRHTFATLAIRSHVDVRTVADMLGHANVAMTLNIYADSSEQAKRDAVAVIGGALALPQAGTVNGQEDK